MLGIIGGTGLYSIDGLEGLEEREVSTPFGSPSAKIRIGRVKGIEVAFLPRHGANHQFLPTEVNYRANIFAMKLLGVKRIVSVSAVGSLKEELAPGMLVIPDQYLDFTKGIRKSSFFGEGVVAHIATAHPVCPNFIRSISKAASSLGIRFGSGGSYACVEGPRLGTRAESNFLRGAGGSIVGMTNVPEAFLAREAQICYSTLAVVTDYDSWHDHPSNAQEIIARYGESLGTVLKLILKIVEEYSEPECSCRTALTGALYTDLKKLSAEKQSMIKTLLT